MAFLSRNVGLILLLALVLFTARAHAFGAGNIASISSVEGKNWRHGDIEDVLKTIACIKHHKWNTMMIKRVYFGNWLRDYSQAMDTAALKKAQPETIRILVWLLSFLGFGYATAEFEVTSERLGVYRPEEHIDNPKDYNENEDARPYDARLRAPVREIELQIDPETGMKNYIANGKGDWATSTAYVKYSFERSIHHGRLYMNGSSFFKGKDADLAEALRCLGQGLHTLEDFGAHTNYVELALRELGYHNVFPHVGTNTMINLHGKQVYPLVTGTFGTVDFYHSVLGEATDHFTQSEVNEMDDALGTAQQAAHSSNPLFTLVKLLSKVPGTRELCDEAEQLQASSQAQARSLGGQDLGAQGAFRGADDFGGSTRGFNDWDTSRASQPGFPPQYQSHDAGSWNAPQQDYQQHQQSWGPPPHHPQWQDQGPPPPFQQHDQFGGTQNWQHQQGPPPGAWDQQSQSQSWNQQPPIQHDQHQQPPSSSTAWDQQAQTQQPSQQPHELPATQQSTAGQTTQQQVTAPAGLPGMPDFDPAKTIAQIYPILVFRDKVVRTISAIIEKIPGLEALVERITETLTVFILSLLAPFVRPVINAISKTLQVGSTEVVNSSGQHQYEVWTNASSSDPTHSMLSKDHFSNILNEPAGHVAAEILKFIAPRVLYAWEHPNVPVDQVMRDVEGIFHHPAIRNESLEVHRNMFRAVKDWVDRMPDRQKLNNVLSSESVRAGKNHKAGVNPHTQHGNQQQQQPQQQSQFGGLGGFASFLPGQHQQQQGGHSNNPLGMVGDMIGNFTHLGGQQKPASGQQQHGGLSDVLNIAEKLHVPGVHNVQKYSKYMSGFGGGQRGLDDDDGASQFRAFEGSEMGGSRELQEAAADGDRAAQDRDLASPSPMPMPAPAGYEQYATQDPGYSYGSGQGEQDQYQYQTNYQDPYQQGDHGGNQSYGGGGYYGGR
ncbi:heterokaryon incompatibility protein Het-C-domain-containing protein [Exophiala viscosa]|uniref:heterokaryon incompatibility protein Het-C-domain-containing protein n=1 Tax=Exophiala viscosa TaxID=2486360 RepID=UPI00219EBF06|nr:heterokaryon incompatibility protein Het-C-domain-containing protein [Exophiala viscosa]